MFFWCGISIGIGILIQKESLILGFVTVSSQSSVILWRKRSSIQQNEKFPFLFIHTNLSLFSATVQWLGRGGGGRETEERGYNQRYLQKKYLRREEEKSIYKEKGTKYPQRKEEEISAQKYFQNWGFRFCQGQNRNILSWIGPSLITVSQVQNVQLGSKRPSSAYLVPISVQGLHVYQDVLFSKVRLQYAAMCEEKAQLAEARLEVEMLIFWRIILSQFLGA